MPIATFLVTVESNLKTGVATEHTYRPALQALFESVLSGVTAINEPRHAIYGAPDFVLMRGSVPFAHVEAKDVGIPLDSSIADSERTSPRTSNGKQLQRYRAALPNLLYTDGLVWYWFRSGVLDAAEPMVVATWNAVTKKLTPTPTGVSDLRDLLQKVALSTTMVIGKPRELAQRLAQIAHWLRDVIIEVFNGQGEHGSLHQQREAFKKILLPDLEPDEFADMYAQTIVYGLFAARLSIPTATHFTRMDAATAIPKTNPFLRSLFQQIAGYDLDEQIAWLVDDCASLLAHTDMSEVLRDFGRSTRQEDPVVHFYETFLAAYDPKLREARGVYYTPEPVVSFIVRAVHAILQTEFNKLMGLADEQTIILDPATGTATFLNAVIQTIHHELTDQGLAGTWDQYVPEKLLNRIFGFELLMAPYTIAHLKLGILLKELGYSFGSKQRLGIYLTNALANPPEPPSMNMFAQKIVEEGKAANDIKQHQRVMVVLGNPPYSGHSANTGDWIRSLLHGKLPEGQSSENYYMVDGLPLGERNPKWLQDDYVKFIRFGEWRIAQTGEGILAYISNNGYLDNPTFRGMRESLLKDFDTIYILNLHGNSKKRERTPDGGVDQNVFDIQQGVAIGIFIKKHGHREGLATVYYADLWGEREDKYALLNNEAITSIQWQHINPTTPWYLFIEQNTHIEQEYELGFNLISVFPENTVGLVTGQDSDRLRFTPDEARLLATRLVVPQSSIKTMLYRPYDTRQVTYDKTVITRPRIQVMKHMLQPNVGIGTIRSIETQSGFDHIFCTEYIMGLHAISIKEGNYIFPLYLYHDTTTEPSMFDADHQAGQRRANLSPVFIAVFAQKLGLEWIDDGRGDLATTFGPEDVFHYSYAIFHSPTYRERYAEFLKIDFPRVPITSDSAMFKALVQFGAQLVDLHLLRLPNTSGVGGAGGAAILQAPGRSGVNFPTGGSSIIEKVTYIAPHDDQAGEVWINTTQKFVGIEPETWEMQIGGYQPLDKWLKDRKGRALSSDDSVHYLRMIIALRETRRLMVEIDQAIPSWPIA